MPHPSREGDPLPDAPRLAVTDPSFAITGDEVKAARERSWYARTEHGLAVLRYAEASELLEHPCLRQGATWFGRRVIGQEDEEHRRLRRLLDQAFTPAIMTGLAPRFQALADELVDGFADRGECDFAADFAEPYSARVITLLLGLPGGEWRAIARESAALGLAAGTDLQRDLPRIEAALQTLREYADAAIAERRARPRDDFMTTLVRAHDDSADNDPAPGKESDADDLRDTVILLIFGGYDTTRHQLGLAVQTFLRHPGQWARLARDPDLGGQAVEEIMRVNPAVRWVTREALEDFEFRDLAIEAGTTVHLFSEAAGTDPRVFGEPGFDITAGRAPHTGFGGGPYHCAGHLVARCDMSAALPLLARRLRDPRPLPGARWLPGAGTAGPVALPIAFTPAP